MPSMSQRNCPGSTTSMASTGPSHQMDQKQAPDAQSDDPLAPKSKAQAKGEHDADGTAGGGAPLEMVARVEPRVPAVLATLAASLEAKQMEARVTAVVAMEPRVMAVVATLVASSCSSRVARHLCSSFKSCLVEQTALLFRKLSPAALIGLGYYQMHWCTGAKRHLRLSTAPKAQSQNPTLRSKRQVVSKLRTSSQRYAQSL